jgi:hypothetical protein
VLVTNALVPGAARYRVDPDDAVCEYTAGRAIACSATDGMSRCYAGCLTSVEAVEAGEIA